MSTIGEIIGALRREKGVTQEELGRTIGVSMQAVSKWENGGVPDTALLPAIADYFEVTIDKLFGRERKEETVEVQAARLMAETPQEKQMRRALDICWALQRGMFGNTALDDFGLDKYIEVGNDHTFSQMLRSDGITLMCLQQKLPYYFLAPEPEYGWNEALIQPEKHAKLFADLAQPDFYRALVFTHSRPGWSSSFSATFLAKQLGILETRAEEILDSMIGYKLVTRMTLEVDDREQVIYRPWHNPSVIGLLAFANDIIERAQSFCYNNGPREKPYFHKEA